jgi:phage terminase large subunit
LALALNPTLVNPVTELILQPKQELLRWYVEESPKTIIGYGGSRGGSKSSGAQRVQLIRRWKWARTRGIILRRKYKELKENHIDPFFTDFPHLRRYYNVQDKTLTLPNGAALVFWHAETFADLKALQGAGFMDVVVDEATHFKQEELEWLAGINRQKGIADGMCKTVWTCNPGDVGHAYIQRVCVEGPKDASLYHDNEDRNAYAFIQAYGWDNAFWADGYLKNRGLNHEDYYRWTEEQRFECFTKETDYGRKLMALPEALRTGWLYGQWDQFAGQYFSNFVRKRHVGERQGSDIVCKADGKVYSIEKWWPKWVSLDWGFSHDTAVYWHTTAADGRHITYRQWVVNNTTPRMLGEGIVERSINPDGSAEKIQQFFISPDAFADRTGESTIAQLLTDVACRGDRFPLPAAASDDRIGGWQLLYQLLESDQWLIAENCDELISCLPMLVRDDKKPEDIKKVDGDDPADSARYGLYSRLGSVGEPKEVRAAKKVQDVTDPTARAMILEKFFEDESKKDKPQPIGRRHGPRRNKFGF